MQTQSAAHAQPIITHAVTVLADFSWKIAVHGHELTQVRCQELFSLGAKIDPRQFVQVISLMEQLHVCAGHPDEHFLKMAQDKKGRFVSTTGDVVAFVDKNAIIQLDGNT